VAEGYRDAGGSFNQDVLDWWHTAALLKIAGRRYRSLDTMTWAAVPHLLGAARALLERRTDPRRTVRRGPAGHGSAGPEVTDPERMTQLLRRVLPTHPDAVHLSSAEILRMAPGRRVVVRYGLTGTPDPGAAIIAKAYAEPARAVLAHENLVLFQGLVPTGPGATIRTQQPLGVLPDRGIVVCGAAPGTSLTMQPEQLGVEVARRCAAWLHGVHAAPVRLSRVLDLHREVLNLRLWAAEVGSADPHLARPAERLAHALAEAATGIPTVTDAVIHKDLHFGHVIVADAGSAAVIDLDEARMGDPAFDLGHLAAYADEQDGTAPKVAFLTAYGPLSGPEPDRRFRFFYAYTLLKITKQEARGTLSDEAVRSGLHRMERGMTCLAG